MMLSDDKNSENTPSGTEADSEARCSEEEIYLETAVEIARDRFIAVDEVEVQEGGEKLDQGGEGQTESDASSDFYAAKTPAEKVVCLEGKLEHLVDEMMSDSSEPPVTKRPA